jgi:hypothetical protein
MKAFTKVVVVVPVLLFAIQLWAQSPTNPIQIALLRWYPANIVTQIQPCGEPQGLAFDGSHMWVACGGSGLGNNSLLKYNTSDLANVTPVGGITVPSPYELVYDGEYIWASTNNLGGQVFKVNAATGAIAAMVNVGSNPHGMAFDGTNVWVANYGRTSGWRMETTALSQSCWRALGRSWELTLSEVPAQPPVRSHSTVSLSGFQMRPPVR